MVGTHWLWVTPYRSMAASEASASKCSMTTAVPPRRCTAMQNCSGAAW